MISQLLERLFPWKQPTQTGADAKRRLKLVIAHDRAGLSPEIVEKIRQAILQVVEQYADVDSHESQFSLESDQSTTALIANLPIRRIKKEDLVSLDEDNPPESPEDFPTSPESYPNQVTVKVPATTANLGPGFDCLGAALTLYNQFEFTCHEKAQNPVSIVATGRDAERVSTDASNLAYQAFKRLYDHIQQAPPPVSMKIQLNVPLARGLGSSATAIVGGLMGANRLAGNPLSIPEVMKLAILMEGHPDNVVPALLGGCRLATQSNEQESGVEVQIPWHSDIVPVVAIPDFELSTEAARAVLPSQINRADAIFNLSQLGLLLRGLEMGRGDWLAVAMKDKLHQPYRQDLIKGYSEVQAAALAGGAYGLVISGAGPTLIALTSATQAESVASAMKNAWTEEGVMAETHILQLNTQGSRYISQQSTVNSD